MRLEPRLGPFAIIQEDRESVLMECTNCGLEYVLSAFIRNGYFKMNKDDIICPNCLASNGSNLGSLIWNFLGTCELFVRL